MSNKPLETIGREFVNGYMAGSCNSFDECLRVFEEELKEHNIAWEGDLENHLNDAIESAGIFNCDCCGWWCWDYEHSPTTSGGCNECYPAEDEDEDF